MEREPQRVQAELEEAARRQLRLDLGMREGTLRARVRAAAVALAVLVVGAALAAAVLLRG